MEIHVLYRQGKSIRAIAKALQISRNSVRKYLRNIAMTPSYSKHTDRLSKLDPSRLILKRVLMRPSRTGFRPRCCFAKYRPRDMKARRVFSRIISAHLKSPRTNRYSVLKRQRVNNYKLTLLLSAGGGTNSKPLLPHWGTAGLPMFALANMSARKTGWRVLKVLYISLAVCPKSCCSIMPSAS